VVPTFWILKNAGDDSVVNAETVAAVVEQATAPFIVAPKLWSIAFSVLIITLNLLLAALHRISLPRAQSSFSA
jgi:hypothetical protein